jgi:SAM-dependent methyltransferase
MNQTAQVAPAERGRQQRTPTHCPICGRALFATRLRGRDRLITGDGPFEVMECTSCQFGLTDPQLSDEELARYYPPEYYDFWGYSDRPPENPLQGLLERFRTWSAERHYEHPPYVLDEGVTPGRMLDVGCGSGDLLEHFAKRGWEIYGIDPSASAAAAAEARGARIHQGTLQDQPWPPGSFGLITFQHALEHVAEPVEALKRARELLEPGGLLLIDVPNWACWQRRLLFRSRWHPLELPRHLQHFSPRALERLAGSLGLRVRTAGTSSNVPVAAYSLHYALFGHMRGGWRLWLSYALGLLAYPVVLLGDRLGGGDVCFIVMQAPPGPSALSDAPPRPSASR